MQDAAHTHALLTLWESFYVIVGSSGAALTGLQFVVIALMAESRMERSTNAVDAFGTPQIVHFCTVLLLSAVLSAPWRLLTSAALAIGAIGLGGVVYMAIVIRRARGQKVYQPVLEDWLWHMAFPLTAHIALVAAGVALYLGHDDAEFAIGTVCLCLLFIGIHNAWDTVVFVALERPTNSESAGR